MRFRISRLYGVTIWKVGAGHHDRPFYSLPPAGLKWRRSDIAVDLRKRKSLHLGACEIGLDGFAFASGLERHTIPTNANRLCFTAEELDIATNFELLRVFVASLEPAEPAPEYTSLFHYSKSSFLWHTASVNLSVAHEE
jgi:hypothetical protein